MRVALFNHHTPYVWLFSHIPETEWYVFPTVHAPSGWRSDQRPQPKNVFTAPDHRAPMPDVFLLMTPFDIESAKEAGVPMIYLALNHRAYEQTDSPDPPGRLVCVSEMKAQTWRKAGYAKEITVIPSGVPPQGQPWTGTSGMVLTVANTVTRTLFDLDAWLALTAGTPVALIGDGNEGVPGAVGPVSSWQELHRWYRESVLYLNITRWPYEDGYNLAMLEAMSFGCPTITLASPSAPRHVMQLGKTDQAHQSVAQLLAETPRDTLAKLGDLGRQCAREDFALDTFAQRWHQVLRETAG
ncbi:MAG: hypothetical protein CL878_11400 [Dehalococcoidia bacterium]|nr:hypothetical protein [Dehalococcoidia bacterium]